MRHMAQINLETELHHVLKDLDGISPKTSTYAKLKAREKQLRLELREMDKKYIALCKASHCFEKAQIKGNFNGAFRYYNYCKLHRSENAVIHNTSHI